MARAKKSADQKRKEQKILKQQKRMTETKVKPSRREQVRENVTKFRERQSADHKRILQEQNRVTQQTKRNDETSEKTHQRLVSAKECMERNRNEETPEKRQTRLVSVKKGMERNRNKETPDKRQQRLGSMKKVTERIRNEETPDKKQSRLVSVNKGMKRIRNEETPDKKQTRLATVNKVMKKNRNEETPDKKQTRLATVNKGMKKNRNEETPDKKQTRLATVNKGMKRNRNEETPDKKQIRLASVNKGMKRNRNEETPVKKQTRLATVNKGMKRHRNDESKETAQKRRNIEKERRKESRQKRKTTIPTHDNIVQEYRKKVKNACDYVCVCCHRMMYRITVVQLKEQTYTKMPTKLLNNVMSYRMTSADNKEWICRTCHLTLKRGKMPAQAKANKLHLVAQPDELKELNSLETRLISRRIPFMKMVGLPRGKQQAIHGPAVNVPSNVDDVCKEFPRLPSEMQMIPLKLKRRMKYKSHYMYEYVRPARVLQALRWLKDNNVLYHDIQINDSWSNDAMKESPELWESMTKESTCEKIPVDETIGEPCLVDETNSHAAAPKAFTSSGSVIQQMRIHDVPQDGNCLFASVCYHLKKLDVCSFTPASLRSDLAKYMADNADCYRDFVCARIETNDRTNADTEQPTEQDYAIANVNDVENRKELQWVAYLDELEYGKQWGEHISLQAMADMLSLEVCVHRMGTDEVTTVCSRYEMKHVFNLGLAEQCHYVALEAELVPNATISTECENDGEACESKSFSIENVQDEDAFDENATKRGLPYESCMVLENPDMSSKLISVAPAESEKPRPLLSDENFEELANPDKYPDGMNALTAERDVNLDARKYFNQRLLDVDGRFAKSVEYLLAAEYAVESKQVTSNINHFVFRRTSGDNFRGKHLTAGQVRKTEAIGNFVKCDHAYQILRNVRGSPAYFQGLFYDVLAMVRQLGIPTWFFTVSSADMQWPDLLQTIARQYGKILSDDDVKNLSFEERSMWLRTNPVTAARHFQYRLDLLFSDVLKAKSHPIGEIIDHVIRIEFQARGSPHAHTLLWIKDAPKIDEQSDEEVCQFIDKCVTCCNTQDDEDNDGFVKRLQVHKHSFTCRRKGVCRFNYPKPPSYATTIARELDDDAHDPETIATIMKQTERVLESVATVLKEDDCDDLDIDALLEKAQVGKDEYMNALKISERGIHVILQRNPNEVNTLAYNPTILKAFQANTDLQYVVDAYACVMYLCAYLTKSENGIGHLLKQAADEYKDKEVGKMLRHVGSTFLNHRELSAQEAVYRILSMPMKKLSRMVVFINTDTKSDRHAILKTKQQLEALEDDDENVFQTSMLTRYSARPDTLEDICLADFASTYSVAYCERDQEDGSDEGANEPNARKTTQKRIYLKDGLGTMYERRQPAVIRFRKFDVAKDTSNFYRAKLMLYTPWRNERTDLIGNFPDYRSHYNAREAECNENECRYTTNMRLIDEAIHQNAVLGPPEHMWPNIAPGNEHQNDMDRREGTELERDIEQEDLDANADMIERPMCTKPSDLVARYESELDREKLSPPEYRKMVRSLNEKQKQIVFYHRHWCKSTVTAVRKQQKVKPYRVFLSGPGGVGKTHVIKLICSDTKTMLPLCNQMKPTDLMALLTAPTGVAAFNVGGLTIHSALLLRVGNRGPAVESLTCEKLNTLRAKMENLHLLVIDEVSMVGSDMLLSIHKRLNEIKGTKDESALFGDVCILAVGDLFQLPPVMQSEIFDPVRDPLARLCGSLWKESFQLHELDEVMRQKDDCSFAELLCRVRTGEHTKQDIEVLKSREIKHDDADYPFDALHVFALNRDVDTWNNERLNVLAPRKEDRFVIKAIDDKTDSTGLVDVSSIGVAKARSQTGGLHTELVLCIGARVMVVYNIDTSDGLVNGVIGTVEKVITNDANNVLCVLVTFDNVNIGKKAVATSQWKQEYPHSVPIQRIEGRYEKNRRKGAQICRRQFPLTLAWGVTIHKCQGLTVEQIVVSMKDAGRFGKGQAYVAFSRVKTLVGLNITDFDAKGIKTNTKITEEMVEMRENKIPLIDPLKLLTLSSPEWLTVGHLNVRYFMEKIKDISTSEEKEIISQTDVMCFTETYLTPEHNIDVFLGEHGYVAFRDDVPSQNNHQGKHGVMICASEQLQPQALNLVKVSGLESQVVALKTAKSRLVVAVVYKKPSQPLTTFVKHLEELLCLMPDMVPTVVLGDFNQDLLTATDTMLHRLMSSNGFMQCVKVPTTDSGTLLDHIYFNNAAASTHIDVHDVYYSDHDAVFITIDQV